MSPVRCNQFIGEMWVMSVECWWIV